MYRKKRVCLKNKKLLVLQNLLEIKLSPVMI